MKNLFLSSLICISLVACAQNSDQRISETSDLDSMQTAYFASGCFWCVEAIYESVEGVHEAVSGYAGGTMENPTYELVSAGKTNHAETVKIYYDSSVVSFEILVDVFFNSHDPSTKDQQGPDHGPQYRSIAFFQTKEEKHIIDNKITALEEAESYSKITTQVLEIDVFYQAEEYHQDYEKNHPNNPYIRAVSIPRIENFKKKMPEVLK